MTRLAGVFVLLALALGSLPGRLDAHACIEHRLYLADNSLTVTPNYLKAGCAGAPMCVDFGLIPGKSNQSFPYVVAFSKSCQWERPGTAAAIANQQTIMVSGAGIDVPVGPATACASNGNPRFQTTFGKCSIFFISVVEGGCLHLTVPASFGSGTWYVLVAVAQHPGELDLCTPNSSPAYPITAHDWACAPFTVDNSLPSCAAPTPAPTGVQNTAAGTGGNTSNVVAVCVMSPTITPTFSITLTPAPGTPTFTITPTATPTVTFTATPTYTLTSTPTATRTNTPTFTATPTATATYTPTMTRTNTPTFTATPTSTNTAVTPTFTVTLTATPTATSTNTAVTPTSTNTPTATSTATPTSTPTITLTSTPTPTRTNTPTFSATPTSTNTISPGPSPTSTSTYTATPTDTSTHTQTETRTSTATPSATLTHTPTATITLTSSVTSTPTFTSTATPSNTVTDTETPGPSATNSVTPSNSPTLSHTPTATPTYTQTASRTVTGTFSATPTATPTFTESPVNTFTNSPTASLTATASATSSVSPTLTATRTHSPTSTATPTFTSSATQSSTWTHTATPSASPTATETPTDTPTATPSATITVSPTFSMTWTASETPVPLPYTVTVSIYNSAGERVRTLFQGALSDKPSTLLVGNLPANGNGDMALQFFLSGGAGSLGSMTWQTDNDNGQSVSGGMYYVKVDSVDSTGQIVSFSQGVAVVSPKGGNSLAIFSPSGELVREIPLTTLPASLVDFSVESGRDIAAGNGDPNASSLAVSFNLKDAAGGIHAWAWDGLNSLGQPVQSGTYIVRLVHSELGSPTLIKTEAVTILALSGSQPEQSAASAFIWPQPYSSAAAATGHGLAITYKPIVGLDAQVRLYNLAGELVGTGLDGNSCGNINLPGDKLAAGIYLVEFQLNNGPALLARRSMKMVIAR